MDRIASQPIDIPKAHDHNSAEFIARKIAEFKGLPPAAPTPDAHGDNIADFVPSDDQLKAVFGNVIALTCDD